MNADNSLGFNQSSLILSLGKQTACKNSCINKFIEEDKHVEIAIKSKLSLKKDGKQGSIILWLMGILMVLQTTSQSINQKELLNY